mmetsp:Transcript_31158/g.34902  ORF Transcript_31158/g.34902 Transcript_31158/m.34902 type:complete len:173 (+) Transcript_31158:196-714(+)
MTNNETTESKKRTRRDIIMPPKQKHKLLLRNLSDGLSTGADGTGILTDGRSSRSTRRTNQLAAGGAVAAGEDVNVAMVEGGTLDIVDEVGEEFGNITAENDRDNYNETKDNDSDEDMEDVDDGSADKTPCARGGRSRNNCTDNNDENEDKDVKEEEEQQEEDGSPSNTPGGL